MYTKKEKSVAKRKLNKIIGSNIRRERNARNFTGEKIFKLINVKSDHLSYIEQGRRGASVVTLQKISNCFDIPIDDFFIDKNVLSSDEKAEREKIESTRKEIIKLVADLNEAQLEYVVDVIEENCLHPSPMSNR